MRYPLHNQEKKQFIKLFKQDHVDHFEDRFNVLKVFLTNEAHLSAEELTALLEKKGYLLDVEFVRGMATAGWPATSSAMPTNT